MLVLALFKEKINVVRRLTFAVVGWSPPRHPVYCDADGEDDVVVGDGVVVGVVGGAADVRCC